MIKYLIGPAFPYIAGAAVAVGVLTAWYISVDRAYDRGFAAAHAEQRAVDADAFRNIIKEYNDATDDPITDAAADCILRRIAGTGGTAQDCGDL